MAKTVTPLVHIDYNLVDTTFDRYTDFEGDLKFDHSLKINGKFKGTIKTDGFLYIGKSAEVTADIEAGIVILEGSVRGNIIARDRIEMMQTGKLYGDLDTAKLQIADGVVFEGNCRMIKERKAPHAKEPVAKPEPKAPVKI